jgi:hypothetical protein
MAKLMFARFVEQAYTSRRRIVHGSEVDMSKVYRYKGKNYCETDTSLIDDLYGGDLYDLYMELRADRKVTEDTIYRATCDYENSYDSAEELVEEEFSDLLIGHTEDDMSTWK